MNDSIFTIYFPSEAVFHTLTHFKVLDDAIREDLRDAGFRDGLIDEQLRKSGSKFFASFARSPQEAVRRLRQLFPDMFVNERPDADGKIRLSFRCLQPIGCLGVIEEADLTPEERLTIREERRNGCLIRTVQIARVTKTCECQLILTGNQGHFYLCSLFPGELAPPLPRIGAIPVPYWTTHLFVKYT